MNTEDPNQESVDSTELDASQIYSGVVISAVIAFVMVLNSIANTDVGGIFQQILIR